VSRINRVLIIEDDSELANTIAQWLQQESFTVKVCQRGKEALNLLEREQFDIILLDILLPDAHGLDICKTYRQSSGTGRILILSACAETDDKIAGLQIGADDYLTKPFDMRELLLRISTLLRRSLEFRNETLVFEDVEINPSVHKATRGGKDLKLCPQEFALLEFMMHRPNHVFSSEILLKGVWHGSGSVDTVRTHIKNLRKKLEKDGQKQLIRTIQGVGYSLTIEW
jgi:DNA-binding response OmpR family regulator